MKKRIAAMILSILMVVSLIPISAVPVSADTPAALATNVMQNTNLSDGIVMSKYAQPHLVDGVPDGTVDITIEAHTTGVVKQTQTVTPTDIVLVLDLSGSMNDRQSSTTVTTYTEIYATETHYNWGIFGDYYHAGLGVNATRYVKVGSEYVTATRSNDDANGHEVWYYTSNNGRVYIYPAFENPNASLVNEREHNYAVVQFYNRTTSTVQGEQKITLMKNAVDEFINSTEAYNESVDVTDMHRIAIVKFGTAAYYNNSNLIAEGDNQNNRGYNYTQVVKGFTTVDEDGAAELIDDVDDLTPGGATAVDYGMNLARLLYANQDEEDVQGRKKVVIVLTDGSPTHNSNYEASVAGSAINHALELKEEGVTIYTISVEEDADATELGSDNTNQFMHYLSSNYPSASYANNRITVGTGSPTAGYYLTPDGTQSLDMIFDKISQEVGTPTITLGDEAILVDEISEYFTITDDINSVKVETLERISPTAWGIPVDVTDTMPPTVMDGTVTVRGFDFDSNYISNEPRIVDGKEFYGKMLVLTINVTPDYQKIDTHADEIAADGGFVPTNYGVAEVMSGTTPVAKVESPTIQANTVTYEVDGGEYATYYRFPGSNQTLIDEPTLKGHTFGGWSTTDVSIENNGFVMPADDITIVGEFTPVTRTVSYQYVGLEIPNRPALPDSHDEVYGATVKVADQPAKIDGYTFIGWYPQDEVLGTSSLTSFTMPDHDVVLLGRFTPANTTYKVEHYTENLNGTFKLEESETLSELTGDNVSAVIKNYEGFTFDEDYDDGKGNKTVASGVVAADGSLVLTLYYIRNEYEVTYEYVGTVPAAAEPSESELATYADTYKYGETVTIEDDASALGYIFTGWYSTGGTVTPTTQSFTMPNHAVTLRGYFTARTDVEYKVEHYFEDENGDYIIDTTKTETFEGTTGETITAQPLNIAGYTNNQNHADALLTGEVTVDDPNTQEDETLILKLYYERIAYKVTYGYEGYVPGTADPDAVGLADYTEYVKWGTWLTVKAPAEDSANDYEFVGWYRNNSAGKIPTTGFEMPMHNVELLGHFEHEGDHEYKIHHYFENENGEYVENTAELETLQAPEGAAVNTVPLNAEYYTFKADHADNKLTGNVIDNDEGLLELHVYYERTSYTVTYLYDGTVPSDADRLPEKQTYKWGQDVDIADAAEADGYTFIGWYRNNDGTKTVITELDMPKYNIELAGIFMANTDTPYTVKHYLETAVDGVYETTPYETESFTGTTDTEVTAAPIGIPSYTYNPIKSLATRTAKIAGDGSTVLELYYDRNEYSVTYVYTVAPEGAILPVDNDAHAHGTTVTVKNADDLSGYTFSGWSAVGVTVTGGTNLGGGAFTMPEHNVIFTGHYVANNAAYAVEHWVEDGDTYVLHGTSDIRIGEIGEKVTAVNHVIHGYSYSADVTESKIPAGSGIVFVNPARTVLEGTVSANEMLTLKFYYTADEYGVTYVIDGAVHPADAIVPGAAAYKYGTEVEVHEGYDIPGYIFSGWLTTDVTVSGDKFDMPANDVAFRGSFTADTVNYKIKYWQQVLEGTGTKEHNGKYYDEVTEDELTLSATTGHLVSAYPDYINTYEGFTATPEDNDEFYGYVTADDPATPEDETLVLNLYYDRLTYNVTYVYSGVAPEGVEIPDSYNKTGVVYGTAVKVENKLDAYDGFEFDGWHSTEVNITGGAESFTMPAKNVIIYGFHNGEYEVRYYVDDELYETYTVSVGAVHDVIEEPDGMTAFLGWENPLNVKENKFFEAIDNEFVMPWSDVEIYGEFDTVIPPVVLFGKLTISKEVVAPDDFTAPEEYTFDVYKVKGDELELKDTVVLKVGESVSLKLSPGDYRVSERKADVEGYTLTTVCSDEDAVVSVRNMEETSISFTNTYTEIMLEKDDHFAYIVGYPDGTVRPEANITRAEVVTIFFRMLTDAARNHYWAQTNKFIDVVATDWYNTAISTLANAGVLDGYDDGTFKPNDAITRAELIKIAASFYDTTAGKESEFSDIENHWAETFIEEAYNLGFVDGYGDGTFLPDQPITRAETMKIVNRTLDRVPHKDYLLDSMIKWPDNMDTEKWYYAEIQEATNSHDYTHDDAHEVWTAILPVRDWPALESTWKEEHDGE